MSNEMQQGDTFEMKCFGIISMKQERWNDSFWHFPVENFFIIEMFL